MLRFDRDIAVIELDSLDHLEEIREICTQLSRKTATGELKGVVLDLRGNGFPEQKVAMELYYLDMIRRRSRMYHPGNSARRHFIVWCDPGPRHSARIDDDQFVRRFPAVDSVESGIAMILRHHDVFPGPSGTWSTMSPPGRIRLFAAGCTEKDLSDIPDQLRQAGFEVTDSGFDTVTDGDHVLFCFSCAHGPTEGTIRSVLSCAGRQIVPVCVVMNFSDLVDFDSLLELVSFEMRELLSKILPAELVGSLPSFYDFDLSLPAKIAELLKNPPPSVRCK